MIKVKKTGRSPVFAVIRHRLHGFIKGVDQRQSKALRILLGLVLLALISLFASITAIQHELAYAFPKSAISLVGAPAKSLNSKLILDTKKHQFIFNKAALDTKPDAQSKNIGRGKTNVANHAVQLASAASHTITITDSVSQQAIGLTPQFKVADGQEVKQHIVYPLQNYSGQLVYTMTHAGLKEDVVLPAGHPDTIHLSYTLNLPKELEARKTANGSIGIYSADSALFGNVTFSTPADQAKVEAARLKSPKTTLVFVIPAPIIHKAGSLADDPDGSEAHFTLTGTTLTVTATRLSKIRAMLTIDPSVLVTSNADFQAGNNEGNIDFDASNNQIKRGALTGGSVAGSGWATTTAFTTARFGQASIAYNGYMYVIGGSNGSYFNDVQYAAINTNGTVGAWTATAPFTTARTSHAAAVYNGYLYIMGGFGGSYQGDVQYALINPDGSVGAWAATTSFTTARTSLSSVAYNGYLYILGGYSGTAELNDVQYAPIKANGTIGSWSATTSFTTARDSQTAAVYNGYIYMLGGCSAGNCTGLQNDVQYAPINVNGTVGAWTVTSSFVTGRFNHTTAVMNGYIYVMGGCIAGNCTTFQNDVQYAPINANGSVGTWTSTTVFATARFHHSSVVYNGYVYTIGGFDAAAVKHNDVQYAKIDAAGVAGTWGATTAFTTAREGHTSVAYNGFLYVIGGRTGAAAQAGVQYAPISANGTIGTWTATTAFTTARYGHTSVAYNGFLYVIGGCTVIAGCTSTFQAGVQYAPINTNGTVGTWTATTAFTTSRTDHTSVAYNGYLYVMGGYNGADLSDTQYAPINTNGSVGTWTATTSFTTGRDSHTSIVANGYMYILGGISGTTDLSDVQYAPINTNGTLGTWTATSSFTTGRDSHTSVVANGYVYILGGCSAGCSAMQSDVQYAPINSNGTLGTWAATTSFAAGRFYHTSVAYNGFMYVIGGCNATSGCTVQNNISYAPINNGGPGNTAAFTATTSFTTARQYLASVAYNGYLYVLGGSTSVEFNDVQYAPINANGTVGAFTATTSFPTARDSHVALAYNGYMYVLGGFSGSYLNDVEYAPINANGTIGTWAATTSFNTTRYGHTAVAYNGYLYVLGGANPTLFNDVQYAPINANGTVGSWTATTSFATPRYYQTSVAYNGYIYVIGGCSSATTCTTPQNDVQYAPINTNGTIGSWTATTSFNVPRYSHTSVASNGYLYIMNGCSGSGTCPAYQTDIQYAAINSNGTIGSWSASTTTGRESQASAVYNGNLYIVGGYFAGYLNDVKYAGQLAMPRSGSYSKLIDADVDVNPNKLIVSGTNTGNPGIGGAMDSGGIMTQYKFASAGCLTFNAPQTLATGRGNQLSTPFGLSFTTDGCAAATGVGRYMWVNYTIDDSQTASFPDINGNATTITDFEYYYHPNSVRRLRGGKTFTTQTPQSLDTTPK